MTTPFVWSGFDPSDQAHQVLQGFITLDIQHSLSQVTEVIEGIRRYQSTGQDYAGSGNGYEFECKPTGIEFECLYEGDPLTPLTVDYKTALTALDEWHTVLLKHGNTHDQ